MPLDSAFSPPRRPLSIGARRSRLRSRRRGVVASRPPFAARGPATAFWTAAVAFAVSFVAIASGERPSLGAYLGQTGSLVARAAGGSGRAPERRVATPRVVTPPSSPGPTYVPPEMRVGCR